MRTLEIFSGAGGLALGLSQVGFRHVQLVEFNKQACKTLRKNFNPELVFEGDIRDFSFEKINQIDFVAGGPPCQPFSLGGKHKASADNRDMFPYAVQAIRELKPKGFIFENVKGLLRKSFSDYFEYILLRLTYPSFSSSEDCWERNFLLLKNMAENNKISSEYKVQFRLLNAADYGVPQTRERVFIVGFRSDIKADWSFPEPTHSKTILVQHQNLSNEYWIKHKLKKGKYTVSRHQNILKNGQQLALFPSKVLPWRTVRDALGNVPHPNSEHNIPAHTFKDGAKSYPGHTGSFIDLPAKTLKAGVHGVPGGENMIRYEDGSIRYFTVHEGKLLQTFPENYEITGAWTEGMRQIGNAVPVALARVIGKSIIDTLSKGTHSVELQKSNVK
ncbi:MAG: DNA (cytosine-5-)-methyltransferase [Robiginitomaculum sp.]|nr:MAG: DNA (cytosine-5-)-methyltransferase [Robiginitomaculum sp.]